MNTNETKEVVFKNEENHVKKDEKKAYLARFIKMQVEKGVDIEPYMGKPLSNYDFNTIHRLVTEYE